MIIITFDTTRTDYLGCYGNPWVQTPNIDRFAESAILYEWCFTNTPVTLSAHVSMMTGTYPHTHGVPRNGFIVNEQNVMIAEVLQDSGYETVGFTSAPPLRSKFGIAQGFESYYDDLIEIGERGPQFSTFPERSAETMTNAVFGFLDQRQDDRPLFMFVHYYDPHSPYIPTSEFQDLYDEQPSIDPQVTSSLKERIGGLTKGQGIEELPRLIYRYAAEISYMDHHFGRLIDRLDDDGILDNSIVVLTSDHGESLWDVTPYFSHAHTVHQSTIRALGIVRLPHKKHAGSSVSTPISTADWMPSILRYLELPIPNRVEGRNLQLADASLGLISTPIFSEAGAPFMDEDSKVWININNARSIVAFPMKLTYTPDSGRSVLHDLEADPEEKNDLLKNKRAEADSRAAGLLKTLNEWAVSGNPLPTKNVRFSTTESRNQLEAMGYL